MSKKHLFVMDPFEKLNFALDSSLRMARALMQKDHRCFFATPSDLHWKSPEPHARVKTRALKFGAAIESAALDKKSEDLSLADFDFIHMRKDPPYDLDYIGTTWLLDAVPEHVKILNSPKGLRALNEKLGILRFPDAIDQALVSSDAHEILDFVRSACGGDAVVKPLHLYGGKGIEHLIIGHSSHEQKEALVKLTQWTNSGKTIRLVQPFNKKIYEGEVRAFAFLGEPLAWCLKIPTPGQYLANSNFGSTRHLYKPSAKEVKLVQEVSAVLMKEYEIYVVGYDLIGGKLSEINVTSPRLLTAAEDDNNYYEKFAEMIDDWKT